MTPVLLRLNLEVSSEARSQREALPLVLINKGKGNPSPGLFRSYIPVVVYQLRLKDAGQQSMRRLRQELMRSGQKTIAMSVDAPFSACPTARGRSRSGWIPSCHWPMPGCH